MKHPVIQFGLETEIGITRDNDAHVDVVAESIALVRSVTGPGVLMRWDYGSEDPHADMRGFHVEELRQDYDEAQYFAQDAQRELSFAEIKSDFVIGNGARFYNDHAHPEYCTPECNSVEDLVLHDRAGERILMACAHRLSEQCGSPIRLYKNNTDFRGHSYGCHENYLIPRGLPWTILFEGMQAFLATRQIFAGAGKFALEQEDEFIGPSFQISQRSDFISELQSVDTMQRRPLINTRDEPHANPKFYRRFHVILGDANMSPFATRLKVGATALVLETFIRNPKAVIPHLEDPLRALLSISRDPKFRWEVTLRDGRVTTALEIQYAYLDLVRKTCDLSSPVTSALVAEWEEILKDLSRDVSLCRDRVDWVAKMHLVRDFQSANAVKDDDPWLQSLDLEYHRLHLSEGLYYALEQAGQMRGVPDDLAVRRAICHPPRMTRSYIRGRCIQKFADDVIAAQWDHITLQGKGGPIKISLLDLFAPEDILRYGNAVDIATTPDDLRILTEL